MNKSVKSCLFLVTFNWEISSYDKYSTSNKTVISSVLTSWDTRPIWRNLFSSCQRPMWIGCAACVTGKVYPWPSHSNCRCSSLDQWQGSTTRNRPIGATLRRKFAAPHPRYTGGASPENVGSIPAQKAGQSRGRRSPNYRLTIRTVLLLRFWPFGWLLVDVLSWTAHHRPKRAALTLIRRSSDVAFQPGDWCHPRVPSLANWNVRFRRASSSFHEVGRSFLAIPERDASRISAWQVLVKKWYRGVVDDSLLSSFLSYLSSYIIYAELVRIESITFFVIEISNEVRSVSFNRGGWIYLDF